MADAAAPQNSISAGTSMWMNVKVKYARQRVLKDATQGLQKQQAMKRTMREKRERKREREKQEGKGEKNENNVPLLLCFPAQSHWHSEQPCFNHRL